jgi:uncharacterized membrane protein YfcA
MFDLAIQTLVLLALAAFVAGFIDSIAGGGGLITVPALLVAGLPPVEVLGTNKVQGLFGSGSATLAYSRRQLLAAAMSCAGSALGAFSATMVPGHWLSAALPILLVAIALYFALKPGMSDIDRAQRMSPRLFSLSLVPLIGFYDGLFGPGTGSFFMLAFVALAGYGILKATAHTKLLNFASNIGALLVFSLVGAIHWKIGLLMGVCQFMGARIGALLAVRVGAQLVKPLLIVVCLALAAKLLSDPANPLRAMIGA